MTTYESDGIASTVVTRSGLGLVSVSRTFTLTAGLALNDVIKMVKVPKLARIVELRLSCTDLDTHGTPAVVLDVGDGDDTDRFIDGSTIGQAGGVERINVHSGAGYRYTADDTIDVLVQVAPATAATTGTIKLTVLYDMMA